jgi:hypothetical protein
MLNSRTKSLSSRRPLPKPPDQSSSRPGGLRRTRGPLSLRGAAAGDRAHSEFGGGRRAARRSGRRRPARSAKPCRHAWRCSAHARLRAVGHPSVFGVADSDVGREQRPGMVGDLDVVRLRGCHARRRRRHHPHADRRRSRGHRHPYREGLRARVRSVSAFRGAAEERLGLRPPFLRDRPAVPDLERPPRHFDGSRSADSPGHGPRKGVVCAPRRSGLAGGPCAKPPRSSARSGSSATSGKFP